MSMTEAEREAGRIFRQAKARERKEAKAARPKSPKADRGRVRDTGFLQYLRRQPCEARELGGCGGPPDPAHIRYNDGPNRLNPGGGRKNHDRHCNPLCRVHHDLQHSVKEQHFWARLSKDAYETAAGHYAAYEAGR